MALPELIETPDVLRERLRDARRGGARVGLVPTMGALHPGHLSLAQAARQECDLVVATVFVNPTQFGPSEDLSRYPRDLQADLQALATVGCDLAFAPTVETMYPPGHECRVDVGSVAQPLEGEFRPGHFAGVATIVLKLMNLAPADVAYFGQKDYQQSLVIQQMVRDLNIPIQVRVCPTLRDPDGMAMSSRNAYLDAQERERGLALYRGLSTAKQLYDQGERNAERIRGAVLGALQQADLRVDYVAVVRRGAVQPLRDLTEPAVVLAAARVGKTRLLDNVVLGGEG